VTNTLGKSKKFEMIWLGVLALFGLSLLTSKSGLSIFGSLLLLLAIASLDWKKFFAEEKIAVAILLLYPLAILCGLFSFGGGASALHAGVAWPWPLFVLPAVMIKGRKKDIRIFLMSLAIGLVVACVYCWFLFLRDFHGAFGEARVPSFWDISRWGLFTGLALVFLMASLMKKDLSSKWRAGLLFLLVLDFSCVILSNNRGPWLAFGVSSIFFLLLYPKIWKIIVPVFVAFGLVFVSSKSLSARLHSITAVQAEAGGQFTSRDKSNEGRLNMWKVASDFFKEQPWFGTGFENSEAPLKKFLERQTPGYRAKYTTVEYSYRDQHSSPMTILVQFGLLFFVAFWLVVASACFLLFQVWRRKKSLFPAVILSGLVFHLVLCLFYTSFLSYEIVSFIPLLVLGRGVYGND
jgi:O-antigen ligase